MACAGHDAQAGRLAETDLSVPRPSVGTLGFGPQRSVSLRTGRCQQMTSDHHTSDARLVVRCPVFIVGHAAYHRGMVNPALVEQLDQLSPSELAELRDAIEAKLGGKVPADQWAVLERRVAEADAHPDDYITLDEWRARRRAHRTA